MRKKLVGMFLTMAILGTCILSGCGGSGNNDSSTEADKADGSETAEDAEDESADSTEEAETAEATGDEVVIWCFVETHAKYFEWVTEQYTAQHPEVTFRIEVMDNGAMQDRLAVINAAGGEGSPDLIDIEQGQFPRYMTEETMFFVPLNDYMEADDIFDKMVEKRQNLYRYNGNYYGLEHALCPVTMAYREDLFEEYNLEVPTTWEEYKECAKVFAENDIYIASFGDMAAGGDLAAMNMLTIAAGEDYVDPDGNLNITEDFKNVVTDFLEMQKNGEIYAVETSEESWNMMAENRVATYFAADWAAGWLRDNVPEQSGLWRMAPMPKLNDSASGVSVSGGTGLVMSSYTNKDKDVLWDFMKFAMVDKDNCAKRYELVSLYPPVYDAMEACNTPVEYYGDQNLGELWQSLAEEIPAQNQAPWRNTFAQTFSSYAYDLTEGNITIDEMADYLTEAVEEYIAEN